MRAKFATALLACAAVPAAVHAQEITAGGRLEGRIGYGSNPFLSVNNPGGTGLGGGTVSAWLRRRSEVSTTMLTGSANIDQYFQSFGKAENYIAALTHQQTFSAKLRGTAELSYQDTINARNFGDLAGGTLTGTTTDLLSIGQRTHRLFGRGTLNWQPTTRDSFYIGPEFSHTTYVGLPANGYDQYGLNGGYLRQVNERLKLGVDLGAQKVKSNGYPDSTSYTASLRLVYDFNQIWQFEGSVGLIHQTTSGFGSSSTVGFSGKLCGRYPRDNICAGFARQSAPSGFGGLRTDNRATAEWEHQFSSHSRFRASAVYDVSESNGFSIIPQQKYWDLLARYSRDISPRLSGGFSGGYQYRDYGNIQGLAQTHVTGYSVTLDVAYKFGRIE